MNPEFQRNLWLEASPRRLAWAGLVLALIYAGVSFVALQGDRSGEVGVLPALATTGLVVLFASAVLWGVRLAGQAVSSEIGERTWEFQRLSAIRPWTMTWGKLFGATSLAWMVGLSGLVLAAAGITDRQGPTAALQFTVSAIATAVLLQAAGMGAQLIGVRKARAEGRLATLRSAAGGFFSIFFLITAAWLVSRLAPLWVGASLDPMAPEAQLSQVDWWGASVDERLFVTLSLVAFAAWTMAGVWRLMRLELQMRNAPWLWAGFLLFAAVWAAGLATGTRELHPAALRWLAALGPLAAAVYASAFAEPADRVRLRRFAQAARRGQWSEAAVLTPAVAPALVLATGAIVGLAITTGLMPMDDEGEIAPVLALSLLAFMLRDLGVIAFFRFGPRPKRGDFGAIVALAVLYGLGGMVTTAVGGWAPALVFPNIGQPWLALVSGLVQAGVIGAFAVRRLRQPEASDPPR